MDSGSNAGNFDASDRVIFTFQITDTVNGNGTFTLYDNIDHTPGDNVEGTQSLSLNGLVEVRDSSSPAQELALNGSVDIIDDVPTISTGPSSAWLTVDELFLTTDATTSFAAAFIPLFGADGPAANGSKVYALNAIVGASGLVDTATGEAVDLSVVGGVVFGKTHTTGLTVFTVSVDGSGNVTLDQQRAIVHPDTGDPNDSKTLSAANLVTLTETITDGDGDHASATLNIGQSLTFKDDGPSIIASGTVPTLTVDETFLATDASAGFAASFVSSFGADGAGSIAYALGVSSSGRGFRPGRYREREPCIPVCGRQPGCGPRRNKRGGGARCRPDCVHGFRGRVGQRDARSAARDRAYAGYRSRPVEEPDGGQSGDADGDDYRQGWRPHVGHTGHRHASGVQG